MFDNPVIVASLVVMLLGLAVLFGIFDRIGPVETPKGMTRLGWCIIAAGILLALTQSTRTPPEGATPEAETARTR